MDTEATRGNGDDHTPGQTPVPPRVSALTLALVVPSLPMAVFAAVIILLAGRAFFVQLFTNPNLFLALGQLLIAAVAFWFLHSLVTALLRTRRGWLHTQGLVPGFLLLTALMTDVKRTISGTGLKGLVLEFRIDAFAGVLIYSGWIALGFLLGEGLFRNMCGPAKRQGSGIV